MSAPAVVPPYDADAVTSIAVDLFAAMVDGEPGFVEPWSGERPALENPLHTWIDIQGDVDLRVMLAVDQETGERITRALLQLPEESEVEDADFADAVGEIVNVVGGNLKSLAMDSGRLTLPQVSRERPPMPGAGVMIDVWLSWRSAPLSVGVWAMP